VLGVRVDAAGVLRLDVGVGLEKVKVGAADDVGDRPTTDDGVSVGVGLGVLQATANRITTRPNT
jgi:hypothetical protein